MYELSDRFGQVRARTLSSDQINALIELEMNGRILMKRLFFTPNIFYSPDDESAAKTTRSTESRRTLIIHYH
jgi:hypothetical protein